MGIQDGGNKPDGSFSDIIASQMSQKGRFLIGRWYVISV